MPDYKLKRIRYNCWHRGTKEADLILGGFADKFLDTFSESELDEFEAILANNDADLMDWIQRKESPPNTLSHSLLEKISNFHSSK